jgi:hypothetical protein
MRRMDCKAGATADRAVNCRDVHDVTAFSTTDLANIVGPPTEVGPLARVFRIVVAGGLARRAPQG